MAVDLGEICDMMVVENRKTTISQPRKAIIFKDYTRKYSNSTTKTDKIITKFIKLPNLRRRGKIIIR